MSQDQVNLLNVVLQIQSQMQSQSQMQLEMRQAISSLQTQIRGDHAKGSADEDRIGVRIPVHKASPDSKLEEGLRFDISSHSPVVGTKTNPDAWSRTTVVLHPRTADVTHAILVTDNPGIEPETLEEFGAPMQPRRSEPPLGYMPMSGRGRGRIPIPPQVPPQQATPGDGARFATVHRAQEGEGEGLSPAV